MTDANVPMWVAGLGATTPVLAGVVWAIYALFFRVRDETAQRRAAERRNALDEADETIEMLRAEVERLSAKVQEIEERERMCVEERADERSQHAATLTVLKMLIAWGKRHKGFPQIPEDVLQKLQPPAKPRGEM